MEVAHPSSTQLCIPVVDTTQVGEARRAAARLADAAGLPQVRRAEVALVATELAGNLSKYGREGHLFLRVLSGLTSTGLELLAVDRGPGIEDVQRCLRDGFSSGGSPGTGLGAVRRLSAEFDIHSAPGIGTVVLSRIGIEAADQPSPRFQWAAVATPARYEEVCGDTWRVAERGGEIAVMVADGLGHGPLASEAALRAAAAFEERAFEGPAAFMERAHPALAGSRGAAVAAAHVGALRTMRYSGVGNISGSLVSAHDSRGLFSHNGIVGMPPYKARELEYPWPEQGLLIMHSDGLTSRWSIASYDGLVSRHPGIVAAVLHRDHLRGRDDATVLVVRRTPSPEGRP